jgi:hypothetical protein
MCSATYSLSDYPMPRPRYMVCSQDCIVDQATQLTSHIKVLDRIVLLKPTDESAIDAAKTGRIVPVPFRIFVTAVWMREDSDDQDAKYDFEISYRRPDGQDREINGGEFSFKTRNQRFDTVFLIPPTVLLPSGIHLFESRIRPAGHPDSTWLSQSFPLEVVSQIDA